MLYDVLIVMAGPVQPINMPGVKQVILDAWLKTWKDGGWVELEPGPGRKVRINAANVILVETRASQTSQMPSEPLPGFQLNG